MLAAKDLEYELPEELIATHPVEPRDACRMLVVSRSDPDLLKDTTFRQILDYLREDDLLVVNSTAVVPARLQGSWEDSGGKLNGLFLDEVEVGIWRVTLQSGRRASTGMIAGLTDSLGRPSPYMLKLAAPEGAGVWICHVIHRERSAADPDVRAFDILQDIGATPLPPYILNARRHAHESQSDQSDRSWYQTVYADTNHLGSVAAPTAGLHFTPELMSQLRSRGVAFAQTVLHVGAGTFKPIQSEYLEQHEMHSERFFVPSLTAHLIDRTKKSGGRICCVGTTVVRALESFVSSGSAHPDCWASTKLLISPGFEFRATDMLITNFHLPRSTLLALVAALFPTGMARLRTVYEHAVRERYRFYSYGDAMLILP